jgi:hypothetical protein
MSIANGVYAAPSLTEPPPKDDARPTNGVREQLRIIVLSGVAGGIFGLSTLSFYGRPQDNLDNVIGGLCVGILVGSAYSFYSVATRPRDTFGSNVYEEEVESARLRLAPPAPLPLAWKFEF